MPLSLVVAGLLAWPVDQVVDLEPGKEKFVRPATIEWAVVEDGSIATVEVMESGELLFTPVKAGRTLALLYTEGRFAVWRVRVGGKPVSPAPDAVKKACPDLKLDPKGDPKLTATVSSEGCWSALRAFFEGDDLLARELELTFDGKVLQTQLKSMQTALPKLSLRYVGAGLVMEGQATDLEHRAALWQLFKNAVGRVALDDKVERVGSSDAGAKAR